MNVIIALRQQVSKQDGASAGTAYTVSNHQERLGFPMATEIVTCPVCEKQLDTNGLSYHPCDDGFTITLNGQFHASRDNAVQARTYMYSIARRHEQVGIDVVIEIDPYDEYYNTSYLSEYEREQERIEFEAAAADIAAQEHDYAAALARLATLGSEQAAHEDAVRQVSQKPIPLPVPPSMEHAA